MRERAQIILLYGMILAIMILTLTLTAVRLSHTEILTEERDSMLLESLRDEIVKFSVELNLNDSADGRAQLFNESSERISSELQKLYGISGDLLHSEIMPSVNQSTGIIERASIDLRREHGNIEEEDIISSAIPNLSLRVNAPESINAPEFNLSVEVINDGGENLRDVRVGLSHDSENWSLEEENLAEIELLPSSSSENLSWTLNSSSPSSLNISISAFAYGEFSKILVKASATLSILYAPSPGVPLGWLIYVENSAQIVGNDQLKFDVRNIGWAPVDVTTLTVFFTPDNGETFNRILFSPQGIEWEGTGTNGTTVNLESPLTVRSEREFKVHIFFDDRYNLSKHYTIYFYYNYPGGYGYDIIEFDVQEKGKK